MAPTTQLSPSALSRDSDFASELVLNRVMNGQLAPESKKTVTAANRALASKFDATGFSYGVIAENIAAGKVVVEGAQNALTEIVANVKRLGEICSAMDDPQELHNAAKEVWKNISALLDTKVGLNETPIFHSSTPQPLNLTIGEGEHLTVGDIDIEVTGSAFHDLREAVRNGTLTSQNVLEKCGKAVDELLGHIANQGAKHQILSNRYDMLNDLISTYHEASDVSSKFEGPSALFSAVL